MTKAVRNRSAKTAAARSRKAVAAMPSGAASSPASSGPSAVFIHSGFRTSSTWIWKHFRENGAFRAYYEIFHEALGGLTMDGARVIHSDQWRSRHPVSAPYFLEFIPLMDPAGGVRGFTDEPAPAAGFFPDGGLDGKLPQGETNYVAGLIANARDAGRIPVLTCTRTLGRAAALKQAFGGTHILLHRNLFHQWNSFSGQHRTGNLYFLEYLFLIIARSRDDGFMNLLKSFLPAGIETDFQAAIESRYDDAFAIFIAWHVYMTLHAARLSDVVIDVTRLAREDAYRGEIQDAIHAATGQSLDLSDVSTQVDAPWRPVDNAKTTRLTVRLLVDSAYSALGVTPEERAFGDAMVDAAWEEQRAHATYTRAYFEAAQAAPHQLTHAGARVQAIAGQAAVVDAVIETDSDKEGLRVLRAERDEARQALHDLEAAFSASEASRLELGRAIREEERAAATAASRAEIEQLVAALEAERSASAEAASAAQSHRISQEGRISEQASELESLHVALELQATAQAAALAARTAELEELRGGYERTEAACEELRRVYERTLEGAAETRAQLEAAEARLATTNDTLAEHTKDIEAEAADTRASLHNALADLNHEKKLRKAAGEREIRLSQALSDARTEASRDNQSLSNALADLAREKTLRQAADEREAALSKALSDVRTEADRDSQALAKALTDLQTTRQDAEKAARSDADVAAAKAKSVAEGHAKALAALQRTAEYETIAREAAMAEAAEAQRALAYLQVAYDARQTSLETALTELEQIRADLNEARADLAITGSDLADSRAGDGRSRERIAELEQTLSSMNGEAGRLQHILDEAHAACNDLQVRMDGAVVENMRLARLAEARAGELQTVAAHHAEAEHALAELRRQLAESAEREAVLTAAAEAASGQRDDLDRLLNDRQAELASIKDGVSWRAASTLRRLGVR